MIDFVIGFAAGAAFTSIAHSAVRIAQIRHQYLAQRDAHKRMQERVQELARTIWDHPENRPEE